MWLNMKMGKMECVIPWWRKDNIYVTGQLADHSKDERLGQCMFVCLTVLLAQ